MKLVSFVRRDAPDRSSYGIINGDAVIDVGARAGNRAPDLATALVDPDFLVSFADTDADLALTDLTLLPPIPDSRRITCVGLNYKSHIAETGRDMPAYPMFFPRYPESLVGHDQPIVRPHASSDFDFEGEMAFVIGKPGRNVAAADAMAHVAGYSCLMDGTLRDYQRHTTQFMSGKNFARSGSFGPWLVTPDEVGDLGSRTIETRLNGTLVQRATLDDLLFGVADLIAYMSTIWTLQPGDVVATGTTGGVGMFREPKLWMQPGDLIEVEISNIGVLANRVEQEA